MAVFTFEGDVEILVEPQTKLVESVLQKQGFNDGKVSVEAVGQKGDNYVAHVKRFIYEISGGTTFKMVGKIAPQVEELRKMMNTSILFMNEITMYNEVLPKLDDLQNLAGVTEDEKIRFPICYGVITEAPFEFILLEDLNESQFEMLDRFQPLTNDCVRMVLKDLAVFHSLSYVFKNAEPEKFKNIAKKMLNMWCLMDEDPNSKNYFEMTENDIMKLTDNDKYRNMIAGSISQIAVLSKKITSYEEGPVSAYTIIQQGDCWNNNILFRFEDGKPVQNIMIDYQLSKASTPPADILYLIFNCTNHSTRLKHYREWIDYYHEVLEISLARHGLHVDRIYPRNQLDADLKVYGKMMVGISLLLATILVRKSDDVVDFKEMTGNVETTMEDAMAQMNTAHLDTSTVTILKERIEGIVDSFLELELL